PMGRRLLILCLLGLCASARAEVDLKFSGYITSDIRYRFLGEPRYDVGVPTQWQLLGNGWSRNENRLRTALTVTFSPTAKALANNMVRLDYNPIGDLIFTAVAIPIFRPAQLPRSAPVALLDPLRPPPVINQGIRRAIDTDLAVLNPNNLSVVANVLQPEISF